MNHFCKCLITFACLLSTLGVTAQDKPEGTIEVDFVSHYMWRGMDMAGACVQPTGRVSWKGFSLQLEGSSGFNREDGQEIYLTLGYHYRDFNIGVTDYWTTGDDYQGRDLYFFYDPRRSAHQLEANIGYTHPFFGIQAYTMVWGNDYKYSSLDDCQNRTNGKRAFSTYVELNIPFYLADLDWDLNVGVTPFESACNIEELYTDEKGQVYVRKNHFYADGPTCVMASLRATKNFELGDLKVPVFAEFHTNPYLQKANFLVGVSIIPKRIAKK